MLNSMSEIRNAFEFCKTVIEEYGTGVGDCLRAVQMAQSALETPLRNCEIGTVDEQQKRFLRFCSDRTKNHNGCSECPIAEESWRKRASLRCGLSWANMPFEDEQKKSQGE